MQEGLQFLISLFLTGADPSLLRASAARPGAAEITLWPCHSPLFSYRCSWTSCCFAAVTGAELGFSLTLVCLYLQRYKAARHRATAAYPEAPLHSQGSSSQLLDDPKQPLATTSHASKMNDDRGIDKEGTELSALQEQTSRSLEGKGELATSRPEGKSLASVTDDVCDIMVVEESLQEENKSIATSADCPFSEESHTVGESLGREEEANTARQRAGTDDHQDPGSGGGLGQKEAADAGQEAAAEPSSLAKGETAGLTSAGCRRSSRRKPR